MKIVVVVPSYPKGKNVAFQFVHERVKDYQKYMEVQVFCLDRNFKEPYVHERVSVTGGSSDYFKEYLETNKFDAYTFFFLSASSTRFIRRHLRNEKVYIFFMGSDCVSCTRKFTKINWKKNIFLTIKEICRRIIVFLFYMLRVLDIQIINKKVKNSTFVFVSNWSKENSEKDFHIKYNNYAIINNKIDDITFTYHEKTAEDRLKVLSIKSYSTHVYANDILQEVILEFSKYDEFKHFTFDLYGEGVLFDECTEKIKDFKNVNLYRGFLSHQEIADIQNKHGVLIYPKRGDSQGVSRCEAMISGLVPIASDIEAISEFSPPNTAYLVKSVQDFIDALIFIYKNPDDYLKKSKEGSIFIKEKCSYENTVKKEIELIMEKKL